MRKIRFSLFIAACLVSASIVEGAEGLRDPELDLLSEKTKAVYGINLHYTEGPETRSTDLVYSLAEAKDNPALKKALLLFVQEISLYPKDFFRYADCQEIYFVRKLFFKQKPADGLFSRGANYIFYDYSRGTGNTQKIRHNIHHELYHLIGSKHPFWKEHGPLWEALNRADFSYNRELDPHKRNPLNFYAPPEPGFITDYAMTSAEEDRAEVFACLMIPEQRKLMEQWAQKDGILAKKLELMRKFLQEAY